MIILFILTTVVLTGMILFQYHLNKKRTKQLQELHKKLRGIISESSSDEVLLLFTDDQQLIELTMGLNELLEKHKTALANYTSTKSSMKKMISNISHDLKTPLTVTLGYVEMVQMDAELDPAERNVLLAKIHNKSVEVITLIDKFFDLAKLESGDKEIPITNIKLNDICQKSLLEYYDIFSKKGIEVHFEIPEQPIYVMGNEEALKRVLNNLISNAITHGGDGMAVGLEIRQTPDDIYIDVWDKGKGIKEPFQDMVFERMYTLEDSRNKSYQGSGLGLTITKRLVEKLGGTIQITSQPWKKTVFSFSVKRSEVQHHFNQSF
ncbi:sensor histidine kinase [Cytobacillus gottheilii]|uniref:sensor histidine kinase n=1 Tax=Cytobacillus gottheilii TaxID=859144 RepID=UPI00082C7037|nr:sensor histidine kinase [Cytobacillus gottheilii]